MQHQPSPNHDERPGDTPLDMLVLHYTGMANAEAALGRLCDAATKVSAHYLIDEDGRIISLVPEDRRAWHAGAAWWRGNTDINARSIGIELVNPGHEFGLAAFPDAQMSALVDLAGDILGRHGVPPRNVVGHSDVAPRRKQDPGELFDWHRLAQAGIGLWPAGSKSRDGQGDQGLAMLAKIGYETTDPQKTTEAFQRRYRPNGIHGRMDDETAGLVIDVLAISSQ